eukprot:TRINITY_DN69251_c0_g1_i1.p1 TRINITY_DN69251_c0_g1~~TRINITY_DN69251_c0_g1_i1.p1  ORF type:complete len:226 (+),score=27.53 TRINITY_DN69251_c0_g1_i1:49-726(+)
MKGVAVVLLVGLCLVACESSADWAVNFNNYNGGNDGNCGCGCGSSLSEARLKESLKQRLISIEQIIIGHADPVHDSHINNHYGDANILRLAPDVVGEFGAADIWQDGLHGNGHAAHHGRFEGRTAVLGAIQTLHDQWSGFEIQFKLTAFLYDPETNVAMARFVHTVTVPQAIQALGSPATSTGDSLEYIEFNDKMEIKLWVQKTDTLGQVAALQLHNATQGGAPP